MYWRELKNRSWLKKSEITDFFVEKFSFRSFVNNFLELLICQINVLTTFRMVDFFSHFHPIRKYSKYSLNRTLCWECNDTPSLRQ